MVGRRPLWPGWRWLLGDADQHLRWDELAAGCCACARSAHARSVTPHLRARSSVASRRRGCDILCLSFACLATHRQGACRLLKVGGEEAAQSPLEGVVIVERQLLVVCNSSGSD